LLKKLRLAEQRVSVPCTHDYQVSSCCKTPDFIALDCGILSA